MYFGLSSTPNQFCCHGYCQIHFFRGWNREYMNQVSNPLYVCMHVCTYVCTYVRTYVRMYVCMYVPTYLPTYLFLHANDARAVFPNFQLLNSCVIFHLTTCYIQLGYFSVPGIATNLPLRQRVITHILIIQFAT